MVWGGSSVRIQAATCLIAGAGRDGQALHLMKLARPNRHNDGRYVRIETISPTRSLTGTLFSYLVLGIGAINQSSVPFSWIGVQQRDHG
jgi:hypothetical protein